MHMKGGDSRRPITALAVCVELLCCFYIPNKNRSEKTSHTPYFPIQNSISLGKASEFGRNYCIFRLTRTLKTQNALGSFDCTEEITF